LATFGQIQKEISHSPQDFPSCSGFTKPFWGHKQDMGATPRRMASFTSPFHQILTSLGLLGAQVPLREKRQMAGGTGQP
jgi:hypothetical protein